jgi:hypothetical protein
MEEITTKEDAQRFIDNDKEELVNYLKRNATLRQRGILTDEDYQHIAHCARAMVAELFKIMPCGDFSRAVLHNDLSTASCLADDTNVLVLNIYSLFLYNNVPYAMLGKYQERGKPNAKK